MTSRNANQVKVVARLDQAQMAQEFAERVCRGRLEQISNILTLVNHNELYAVEALYKIQEIASKSE